MPRPKLCYCRTDRKAPPALARTVQEEDVQKVAEWFEKDSDLVWADHLFLSACRVSGYDGHGGTIDTNDVNEEQRADTVRLFLKHGAHPEMRNKRKVSPLHMTSRFGLPVVAKALLDGGANPNVKDEVRDTPLCRAVNLGYPPNAEVLLKAGADPNVTNRKGQTPLHRAAVRGKKDLAPLLFKRGQIPTRGTRKTRRRWITPGTKRSSGT